MEKSNGYIIKSKLNNKVKHIVAVDKFHALNKALYYFNEHTIKDIKIFYQLDNAKKR